MKISIFVSFALFLLLWGLLYGLDLWLNPGQARKLIEAAGASVGFLGIVWLIYYARQTGLLAEETKRMADAAREQAKASKGTVAEMQRAQRPVLDLSVASLKNTGRLEDGIKMTRGILPQAMDLHVKNVGAGPAIDIEVDIDHPSRRFGSIRRVSSAEILTRYFSSLEAHSEATFSFIDPLNEGRREPSPETPAIFSSEYSDVYGKRWRSQRPYFFRPDSGELVSGKLEVNPTQERLP